MVANICRLQLSRIEKRIAANHRLPFEYDDSVVQLIVDRCTELESGGRMIDAILTNTMLPAISREMLTRLMTGEKLSQVKISVSDGEFTYHFD